MRSWTHKNPGEEILGLIKKSKESNISWYNTEHAHMPKAHMPKDHFRLYINYAFIMDIALKL